MKITLISICLLVICVDRSFSFLSDILNFFADDDDDEDDTGNPFDDLLKIVSDELDVESILQHFEGEFNVPTAAPRDRMDGTRCYDCTMCDEVPAPSKCPSGSDTCLKVISGGSVVARLCGGSGHSVGCTTGTYLSFTGEACFCKGDLCNGNGVHTTTTTTTTPRTTTTTTRRPTTTTTTPTTTTTTTTTTAPTTTSTTTTPSTTATTTTRRTTTVTTTPTTTTTTTTAAPTTFSTTATPTTTHPPSTTSARTTAHTTSTATVTSHLVTIPTVINATDDNNLKGESTSDDTKIFPTAAAQDEATSGGITVTLTKAMAILTSAVATKILL